MKRALTRLVLLAIALPLFACTTTHRQATAFALLCVGGIAADVAVGIASKSAWVWGLGNIGCEWANAALRAPAPDDTELPPPRGTEEDSAP